MFGQDFLQDEARKDIREFWEKQFANNSPAGLSRASLSVMKREAMNNYLDKINVSTLIMVGEQDLITPVSHSHRMHEAIKDSELLVIADAGHSPTVENPQVVNHALRSFLQSTTQLQQQPGVA